MLAETIAESPVIHSSRDPKEAMNFPSAMSAVTIGKRIARKEWGNADYCMLRSDWLMINRDGTWHKWLVNDGDLMGEDWYIID
jgi:hypothetical protein